MRYFLGLVLLLALALPGTASAAHHRITKREARAEGLRFTAPFVDLLDTENTIATKMDPPSKCMRLNFQTVTCRFSAVVAGRTVRSKVRVHLQDDGLYGFHLPLDFWEEVA